MPFAQRYLGLCLSALLLTGCWSAEERQLVTAGIGTNLHTADMARQTELLEAYAGFICAQATLPHHRVGNGGYTVFACDYAAMDSNDWKAFMIQGMNDIDRRCDSYLQWLDEKRRNRDVVQKQVADIGTATASIMTIANASVTSIGVVAASFGLLRNSLSNYYSRLLLEVESSTISTIVLTNRNSFRNNPTIYALMSPVPKQTEDRDIVLRDGPILRQRAVFNNLYIHGMITRRDFGDRLVAEGLTAFRLTRVPLSRPVAGASVPSVVPEA